MDSKFSLEKEFAGLLLSDVPRPEKSSRKLKEDEHKHSNKTPSNDGTGKKLNGVRSLAWHLRVNITRERGGLSSAELSLVRTDLDL